ncbi:amidohydrolase [Tetragenococcus solitarius]|uniref:Amidohydrolase family protein n=1 Tax=Tetragenococcus solitarius TaxID=71453 RepID=A0ABP6KTC2_9ENTE|nr:amidohydrolase [Tetragenococcus solitarius]
MKQLIQNVRLETNYHIENEIVTKTNTKITDILIEDGTFAKIGPHLQEAADIVIDAKKQLLLPSLREMHIHIDKTYFGNGWQAPIPAENGIYTRLEEEKTLLPEQLDVAEERAHAMVQHYIAHGHTHIRTHVNVDPQIKTKHVQLAKRVLQDYKDQITYEIVAFPQHGLLRNGSEFLTILEDALKLGVTHIGGVDPASLDRNIGEVLKTTFALAKKYNVGIDMHLHDRDTLGAFEIHRILDFIEQKNFSQPVTLIHAFALAGISDNELDELMQRMAKNKVDVTTTVVISDENLTLPVKKLYDNGVAVSFGHDSLTDHWSPLGTGDTIQKLNLFIERCGYIDEFQISQSLKYATGGITPLDEHGQQVWPQIGDQANFILVDAVSTAHMIARQCPISTVFSAGKIIYQTDIALKGAYRG